MKNRMMWSTLVLGGLLLLSACNGDGGNDNNMMNAKPASGNMSEEGSMNAGEMKDGMMEDDMKPDDMMEDGEMKSDGM